MKFRIFIIILASLFFLNCEGKEKDSQSATSINNNSKAKNSPVTQHSVDLEKSSIKWVGRKLASSHDGTIQISSGNIEMRGDEFHSAEFIVDMTTIINSDIENEKYRSKLEGHLKNEDFFNVDSFPESKLKVTNSTKLHDDKYNFKGDLTIKGITHSVDFEGKLIKAENKFSSIIQLVFDRTLWEIQYGSGKFFDDLGDRMILDDVELEIFIVTL